LQKSCGFREPLHALLIFIKAVDFEEFMMPESTTADIIPFPGRMDPAPPVKPAPIDPAEAEARLRKALISLNEALVAQRNAIATWKSALGELRTATTRLGSSLGKYHDSLGQLGTHVGKLRTEAVKLENWAGDAMSTKGGVTR
jgi:hypothetical protein